MQFQVRSQGRERGQVTEVGSVQAGGICPAPEPRAHRARNLCLPLQCQLFPLTWLQVLAARLLTGSALDQSPPAPTHAYTHLFCRRDVGPVLPCRICDWLMSMTDGGGSEDHVACRPWVTELQSISRPCRMFSLLWMNIL